jgi:membrane protease YdiL (CAAX protease family)
MIAARGVWWLRAIAKFAALAGGAAGCLRLLAWQVPIASWTFRAGIAITVLGMLAVVLLERDLRRGLAFLTIDQWRAIDAETDRTPEDAGRSSLVVLAVMATVAVVLTLQEYFGDHQTYRKFFPNMRDKYWELGGFVWWSGWRVLGYAVIPMLVVLALPGQRLRDYHLSFRGFFKHLWIYVLLYVLILPGVIAASTTSSFRHTYPFYRMANRSSFDLWAWQGLYALQFVALEVFFRGFILQGLRRAMGANAIFVMIVPYCMIHYGKPLPETCGAILAGVILGTLAMRTKSIWGGALIHIGVATTMDVLALRGCPPMGSGKYCH